MKKHGELTFASKIKIDPLSQKSQPDKKKPKEEEEILNESDCDDEEYEELDPNFLQELMKDDEKFTDMLIRTNDKAVQDIQAGNLKESLTVLEKMERILEYAAINKKILDRNLVIVCLYNIACNYQAMWVLDKCSKYIDGVIYNLDQSLKQDEAHIREISTTPVDLEQKGALKGIKLRKLLFLLKVYLQHCAVLSQLSKHEDALSFAKRSQRVMQTVINECYECCKEAQKRVESPSTGQHSDSTKEDTYSFEPLSRNQTIIETKRVLDSSSIFRDEVSYIKNILDYATPFINDLMKTTGTFSIQKTQELLKQTRKSLFNWKNNPENNEKYLRKEFCKSKLPAELKDENRSLLGVQRPLEWLETLNIGTIMHMKPLKYKEYAHKKEFTNEITQDSLQEKVIYQSLIYFTIATEMRFIEIAEDPTAANAAQLDTKGDSQKGSGDKFRNSEGYHLKAIELVCRYVNKPCPYINHLISSYQKHYNQDLEVIPEESYCSMSEGITTQEVSREYDNPHHPHPQNPKNFILLEQDADLMKPKPQILTTPKLLTITTPRIQTASTKAAENSGSGRSKMDWKQISKEKNEHSLDRNRKAACSDQFREERLNQSGQTRRDGSEKSRLKREIEERKKKKVIEPTTEIEPEPVIRKSLHMKTKRKLTEEDDIKNIHSANLPSGSFTLGNLLNSHIVSPSSAKAHTIIKESHPHTTKNQKREDENMDPKYFMKKNLEIPTLNLNLNNKGSGKHDTLKTQIVIDKNSIEPELGFMSERSVKKNEGNNHTTSNHHHGKKGGDFHSISPKKVALNKNDPAINLFFYKNFNKFIQNLYIADEQNTGGKKSKRDINTAPKESKLANNPYSKEIAAVATSNTKRKPSQNKRSTPQTAKNRSIYHQNIANINDKKISLSFVSPKAGTKENKEENRRTIDIGKQIRIDKEIDTKRYTHDESGEVSTKVNSKMVKSVSFKSVPGLDMSKMKTNLDRHKTKHVSSPREKH